jgi:hypothetical protein
MRDSMAGNGAQVPQTVLHGAISATSDATQLPVSTISGVKMAPQRLLGQSIWPCAKYKARKGHACNASRLVWTPTNEPTRVAAYDPAAGTVVGQGSFEGITNRGLPPGRVHGAWRSSPAQCAAGPELWSLWVCLATEQ